MQSCNSSPVFEEMFNRALQVLKRGPEVKPFFGGDMSVGQRAYVKSEKRKRGLTPDQYERLMKRPHTDDHMTLSDLPDPDNPGTFYKGVLVNDHPALQHEGVLYTYGTMDFTAFEEFKATNISCLRPSQAQDYYKEHVSNFSSGLESKLYKTMRLKGAPLALGDAMGMWVGNRTAEQGDGGAGLLQAEELARKSLEETREKGVDGQPQEEPPASQDDVEEEATSFGFWHKTKKGGIWISTVQPIHFESEECEGDANDGDLDDNFGEGDGLVTKGVAQVEAFVTRKCQEINLTLINSGHSRHGHQRVRMVNLRDEWTLKEDACFREGAQRFTNGLDVSQDAEDFSKAEKLHSYPEARTVTRS